MPTFIEAKRKGTAEGQRAIVEGYGVTQEYVGCEIRSSMETVIVDRTPQGIPVHFDKHAYGADHVVVAGRVKPHTGFVGEIESGLHKMMLIGLGKHNGAKVYHRAIMDYSWIEIVTAVADIGRRLNMATTAEGIETAEQLRHVHAAGYAEAQGYLISRPMPRDAVRALLRVTYDEMPEAPATQLRAG